MATKKIDAGDALAQQLAYLRWPIPVREYRFAALHLGAGKGLRARLREARTGYLPRSVDLLREAVGRGLHAMLLEETADVGFAAPPTRPHGRRPAPRPRTTG